MITGPAGKLEAVVEQPATPVAQRVAIICHPHPLHGGTMNNKVVTTLVRACQQLGAIAVRFNFRGVGASEGTYDHAIGEQQDLIAVIEWVEKAYPDCTLWLGGFSFGSYVAMKVASKRQAKLLMTIAPPVHHFDFDSIPSISCPWLVAQGDTDEVVPPKEVFAWLNTRTEPFHLIRMPDVGHFFHGKLIELREAITTEVTSFLDE